MLHRRHFLGAAAFAAAANQSAPTAQAQTPPLSAGASDPVTMAWMAGSPPPPDKIVRISDMSAWTFPQSRWSFANMRALTPTTVVRRGEARPSRLPLALRPDIDALTFTPIGRSEPVTWAQSLEANYTDAIIALHRGRIVYERYFGVMSHSTPHMSMSVTKSFFGLLGQMLVHEGRLNDTALVSHYIPELARTAYGDATVRQVLDMTVGVRYSEDYTDPNAEIFSHVRAGGLFPRPPGYAGPQSFYGFLQTLQKQGEHDEAFSYKTVNTDVLGWVIARVTGNSVGGLLSERIWTQMGAEEDGYMLVDAIGVEFAGGGFNASVRDMARFGEMLRCGGVYNGRQIVARAVIDDIRRGGDRAKFARAGYAMLPGWSYRNMWWVCHNEHGAFTARGVNGQTIYIDPRAEMVVARFASHPMAANANLDPTSLPAYHALAVRLMG